MSAFLGPIHIIMYNRVLYQDEMSQSFLTLVEQKGWSSGLRGLVDSKAESAEQKPLEEIIDQSNIHGWLSKAVATSEHRFALVVSNILAENPERIKELQNSMRVLGQEYGFAAMDSAEIAFQHICGVLLDGMPCDFPFDVTESTESLVTWNVATCPHAHYWETVGHDVEVYYILRDAWIDGALSNSRIVHTRLGSENSLRKEI